MAAPNNYSIPSILGSSREGKIKSAPAYTIVGRNKQKVPPTSAFPGPGAYDSRFESLLPKPPQYSMGERINVKDRYPGPGPGAHSPEKVFFCY